MIAPNPRRKGVRKKATSTGARYYVYEMQKKNRRKPAREATARPLLLREAREYARIGAKQGEVDRVVMTNPKQIGWKIVAWYEGGTGKNITKEMLSK